MIRRALESVLKKLARQYPVVTLTGPRQSGKTTLVRAVFPLWRALVGNPEAPAALVTGGDRSSRRRGVQVYSWMDL